MAYFPFQPGQQPMSSSQGVVIASDQSPVSIAGTVAVSNLPVTQNVSGSIFATGSVTALQGTNPWNVGNSSVQVVGTMPAHSVSGVGVFNIAGSVAATGSITALQGNNPWFVQTVGSVVTQYREDTANTSMVGQAMVFRVNDSTSMLSIVGPLHPLPIVGSVSATITPASVQLLGGTNVIGSVAVLQGTNPWTVTGFPTTQNVSGSVFATGSITTLQGTNPWVVTSSGSILGNYGVNSVFANNNTGFADWGVRNDTVASLITNDKSYGPIAVDSSGRQLVKPFAGVEASVWGTASTVNSGAGTNNAASVRVFAAPGTGLKNYITDFMVANTGSVATLLTFIDNDGSVLAKTIAPAGGGSNAIGLASPIVNVSTNQPIGIISGTATSVLHVWAAGYKAP